MALVGGLGLVVRCAALLAGRGRPRRGPQPTLVIAGPYRRCRNPLVGGLIVALAGAALLVGSARIGVATILLAIGAHLWIVLVEEPRMSSRHEAAYRAYLRHVGRWWPRRGRPTDPLD